MDQYFTIDGARLRFRDEGRGPAVLLVHGWTLDLQMWDPQVTALRDAYRLIRVDRRGFGLSTGRPSVVQDVADMAALCDHLAIGRVALLGMSQGARSVLGFALAAPQRIACLVLDGPPDCGRAPSIADDDVPRGHFRALALSHGMPAFRREWAAHPLLSLRTGDPRMHELLGAMLARYPGTDLVSPVAASGFAPGPSAIGAIERPVLIMTGEYDLPSRMRAADDLARQIAGAERAVIAGAGHLANLDNPDAYNAVVRTFLDHHAAPPR